MLPFPNSPNLLEKTFSELNPPLTPSDPFFPFSPPIFASDSLLSATTAVVSSPPSLPLDNPMANTSPLMRKTRNGRFTSRRGRRKDRHSKILTAKGPRDRRIRLSREVARNFFDLQEMLGFDQGSKTVQWLLNMSKHAIQGLITTLSAPELICGFSSQTPKSFTLEFENIVPMISDSKDKLMAEFDSTAATAQVINKSKNTNKKRVLKSSGNAASNLMLARESRAKARARARERTTEKKRMGCTPSTIASNAAEAGSGLLNVNSSLLESMAQVVEEAGPSAHSQCSRLGGERSNEFPAEDGFLLVPILEHCERIAEHSDHMDNIFQEQWDMERILLADL